MQKLFLGESEILPKGYQNKTNTACEGELAFVWPLSLENILHNFVIKNQFCIMQLFILQQISTREFNRDEIHGHLVVTS